MTDWAALYQATCTDLVRYLHRRVWDEDRARDLAQECFARAMQNEQHDAAPSNPRSWLFRIAANLATDEARLVIRRRRHLTLLRAETDAVREHDPLERMEHDARHAAARAALEQLSERDREVLLLWDAGLSYTDIAQQAGLALSAVGTTLSRARRRLAEAHAALEVNDAARR